MKVSTLKGGSGEPRISLRVLYQTKQTAYVIAQHIARLQCIISALHETWWLGSEVGKQHHYLSSRNPRISL